MRKYPFILFALVAIILVATAIEDNSLLENKSDNISKNIPKNNLSVYNASSVININLSRIASPTYNISFTPDISLGNILAIVTPIIIALIAVINGRLKKRELRTTESHYNKGYLLYIKGQYVDAIEYFNRTLELNKSHLNALLLKGDALSFLQRDEESIECYDRINELNPDSDIGRSARHKKLGVIGHMIGRCDDHLKHERYEEAISCLDRIPDLPITKDDEMEHDRKAALVRIHLIRTSAFRGLGRHEEALSEHQEAFKLDELDPHNMNIMGDTLEELDRYEEALSWYEKAIKQDPKNPSQLRKKEHVLRLLGREEEADEIVKKAKEFDAK